MIFCSLENCKIHCLIFILHRENDEDLQIGDVDDRVKEEKPDPEEEKRNERIREFFKKIAGEDMEIDWMELKQVLDYAMANGNCFIKFLSNSRFHCVFSYFVNVFDGAF